MPQVEGQFVQLANEAAAMERAAMERATAPESPGGRDITEAELIDIRSHRRHRLHCERVAEGVRVGITMIRTGLDSKSTRQNIRELFPDCDDAA